MDELPPRTPPRRYRVSPEKVSQSPTTYSPAYPVNIEFDERKAAKEATDLEEQATRLRRQINQLKKDISLAAQQMRAGDKADARKRYDDLRGQLVQQENALMDIHQRSARFVGARRRSTRKRRKTRKSHKISR